MLWQRAASTSATQKGAEEATAYTYLAPGNSMKEPVYASVDAHVPKVHFYDGSSEGEKEGTDAPCMPKAGEQPAGEEPSQHMGVEAAPLKPRPTLTTVKPRKPLAPQAGSDDAPFSYMPPGSSMKDPSYSLKEPVYHVDQRS
jgi:hypothetical protein